MRLRLHVTPSAHRDGVVGRHGGGWKVRLAATPERGRANAELVAFLAQVLAVKRGAIRMVSGHASRHKVVEIQGLDEEEAGRRLEAAARR